MANKYIPVLLRHSPVPKVHDFALLAGLDAGVRGILISVMPLTVYEVLGSAESVSQVYFIAGIAALLVGLMVPFATRFIARRWMYTIGATLYMLGAALAMQGGPVAVPLALLVNAAATVTTFVCFNAYILDYISRTNLGKAQSTNMLYAATPWAIGPLLGVWMRDWWAPLPFLVAGCLGAALLATFWMLRLGNGKQISRARKPAANPLAFIGRFAAQPRLIAGWLFAVVRSCGWWVYVVYLPIFCIEAGLSDKVGGIALSISNSLLFLTPFMLRMTTRATVRRSVMAAFSLCAVGFIGSALAAPLPWVAVGFMLAGSSLLVVLDVVGGLPFLMAVKPSERTEMAAIYSSYRDVSGIFTPGAAWLVLLVAPLPGVFAVAGVAMLGCVVVAGKLHPRLGLPRPSHGRLLPGE
jgi:ACDE family multidrug resistance protein